MKTLHGGRIFFIVVIVTIDIIAALNMVNCAPVSPCPMNFHYEFDGKQWIGVVEIHSQIYNQFRADHIRVNVVLAVNRYVANAESFYLLPYETQDQLYSDIAEQHSIRYRITFPSFGLPAVKSIHVNGLQVCQNQMLLHWISEIKLQYKFYLKNADRTKDADDILADVLIPDMPQGNIDVPSQLITQRVDRLPATKPGCGVYDEKFKYTQLISGGNKITAGTWPWLVAIFRKDLKASDLVFQCTGSLITHRLVLTAAHCFKIDRDSDVIAPKRIVLQFGRHNLRDWTEKHMRSSDAKEIILHADYLSKRESTIFEADIALVVTKEIIEYSPMIRPICLWPSSIDNSVSMIGTQGTLVGWGQPFENIVENVPRKLVLPIVRNQKCFPATAQFRRANSWNVFCAGTERYGYAPCGGDSGSGYAIHANGAWFLRGITSAARGDPILNRCELNTYAIFTDVVQYHSWIRQNMNKYK